MNAQPHSLDRTWFFPPAVPRRSDGNLPHMPSLTALPSLGALPSLPALDSLPAVGSLPALSSLSSLQSLTALSSLPASTGLPPPTALAAATGVQPLAGLATLANIAALSASSALSALLGPGPATALGGLLASATHTLADPLRIAGMVLVAVTVLLLVGALGLARIERAATKRLSHWFGWRSVLVTGWIGTPTHEISHLAACKALGLRVVDYRLFQPDPRTSTLGYVHYVQEGSGLAKALRRFIVGTAPLVLGLGLLTAGWVWLLGLHPTPMREPTLSWAHSPILLARNLLATAAQPFTKLGAGSWQIWVWAYFALSVGVHMAPSRTDLKNAAWGLLAAWLLALVGLTLAASLTSPARVAAWALPLLSVIGSVLVWTAALALAYLGLVWIAARIAAR